MPRAKPYVYAKLTWPEINDAIEAGKIPVVPVGSIEQHGPHLPLDVDIICPQGVCMHAAERNPDKMLVLPTLPTGYLGHVMDYPGTINVHYEHLINLLVDVGKSLAYHGFKKMIFVNGHGSNMPNLDLVARRINLETGAAAAMCAWGALLSIDKDFLPRWRESYFPGGCAHACELETSVYLYLDGDNVRMDKAHDGPMRVNDQSLPGRDFFWVDLFGAGPAPLTRWTSEYMTDGTGGAAHLGTAQKGKAAVDEAAKQLARLVDEFAARPRGTRYYFQSQMPTMDMPWNQAQDVPHKP